MKRVLLEGLLVAAIGAALAFAANTVSPRGLRLSRNYFPGDKAQAIPAAGTNIVAQASLTNAAARLNALKARLLARGLTLADSNQVVQLFNDPRRQQNLVAFIDSRDEQFYQQGHVPGAYLFNHYYPESYLPTILPVCQVAQEIVVYCNGGDCEDSEFAAIFLKDAGIAAAKILVYGGGMSEWTTNGMPVEIGPRNSGSFRASSK